MYIQEFIKNVYEIPTMYQALSKSCMDKSLNPYDSTATSLLFILYMRGTEV